MPSIASVLVAPTSCVLSISAIGPRAVIATVWATSCTGVPSGLDRSAAAFAGTRSVSRTAAPIRAAATVRATTMHTMTPRIAHGLQFLPSPSIPCDNGLLSPRARTAIVLSGGGSRGAYEAGILLYVRQELARPGYVCSPISLGANTDPYQPLERRLRITRQVLEVLAETRHPVGIVTKSALVTRDIDLLAPMSRQGLARVYVSVTTLDPETARTLEPRAAAPYRR